jgi:hypothetical protein
VYCIQFKCGAFDQLKMMQWPKYDSSYTETAYVLSEKENSV